MRRWVRRLGLGALVALAVLLVLVVGAWLFLTTSPGERLIRAQVEEKLNASLPGNVGIGTLDLANNTVILTDLVLRDPEGNVVARVARLEATLGLLNLLSGQLEILRARIERPELWLVLDERGLNLTRAIQAAKETQPSEGAKLTLRIRDMVLSDGAVDFRQSTLDGLAQHFRVEGIELSDELTVKGAEDLIDGDLKLDGRMVAPVEGPLALSGAFTRSPLKTQVELALSVVDAAVKLEVAGAGTEREHLTLSTLRLPEHTVRQLYPAWPLIADASLTGSVRRDGNLGTVDLTVDAGDAHAQLQGGVDLARLRADELRLTARDVDFSKLVENGPASSLALSLRVNGGGTALENLDGEVDLTVPKSTLERQSVGPIELHASAKDGTFKVSELTVQVPGASLVGKGSGTLESIRFDGRLTATRLETLGSTLGRILKPQGLPLSGKGALSFSVFGPPRHPGVRAEGAFERLGYDTFRAQQLTLRGELADVRRPLDLDATLQAGVLELQARQFRDVNAEVATRGRELSADVSARGLANVRVHLEGRVDEDRQGLRMAALELRYPEATWSLQRPSHLRFGDGEVTVDDLALASGTQRLTLSGGLRGQRLDARAELERLELARLPKVLLPEKLDLGGQLDARVKARGTTARPDLAVQLALRDGKVAKFEKLTLELDGTYAKDRARGELKARALESGVVGSFDVPVQGLLRPTAQPVALDLAIEPTELSALFAALEVDPGLRGRAAATVHLEGTSAKPYIRIAVDGDHVKQRQGPQGDLDVVVESSREDGTLSARIDLDTMGAQSFVLLKTPFVPRQFLDEKVTGELFLDAEARLEAAFRDIPLEALKAWGVISGDFKGKASLTVDARGSARAPLGKVHLALKSASAPNVSAFDAYATVTAGEERIALTLTALRGQQRLADVGGQLESPLSRLFKGAALDQVPLNLTAELGPMKLSELRAIATVTSAEPDVEEAPDGLVTARLTVSGSPAAPVAKLDAALDEVGIGKKALGKVGLKYQYEGARSTAHAELTSASGGRMVADASVVLDLSSRALQEGVVWRKAPVEGRLVSKGFDPAFLSNLTELVREVGGPLDADATVGGTLGRPQLRGRVEWKDGRLALMGYGSYQRIHLLVKGDNDTITLEDLTAHSGAGELHLTARADRRGDAYGVTGEARFDQFPIIYDDQLEALLTGRLSLLGEATNDLVFIRDLRIPEAHVELPEVRRKDLQELERPDDIVLVRKGAPLYKRRKKGAPPQPTDAAQQSGSAAAAGAAEGGRQYRILVNAPRNIWVRGTDVTAEVGLSDNFRIEIADRTLLFGEVRFLRGRVEVLGRRFDVLKDSQVRFAGPAALPFINITAEHANEREQVAVFTTLRGQGKEVTLKVSSNPALSEAEIYTLLATGRRTLKRGSGSSMTGSEAASVVGSYVGSQVKRLLANKVPVDVLSIEAGAQGLADASVEAGTYWTDKLYVGSVLRLDADAEENENAAAVRLEYQFSPRWSFEFEYGTAQRGGADLIWSRDY